jgi:hypothetical protein
VPDAVAALTPLESRNLPLRVEVEMWAVLGDELVDGVVAAQMHL